MALSGAARGSGSTNTAGQSTLAFSPGSNCTAGAMLVLCVAYDNSGTNGADPYSSITDSLGNTWTSRQNILIDPGAANAGLALRIFTTLQDAGTLTTGSTVTVTFGSTTVCRSWTLTEFTSNAGRPLYITGGGETATTASHSLVTGSIATGQAVLCAVGREGADTESTTDSDTTNGNWSTAAVARRGSGATGSSICSQYKIVTAQGAQTHDVTYASSRDACEAWVRIGESLVTTPPAAALALVAETPQGAIATTPAAATLDLVAASPTNALAALPPAAALALSAAVPAAALAVTPPAADLDLVAAAPKNALAVTPPAADLDLVAAVPAPARAVTPPAAALALVAATPQNAIAVTPPTAPLDLVVANPSSVETQVSVPPAAVLTLTPAAPKSALAVTPPAADLDLVASPPSIATPQSETPPTGRLTIRGVAPEPLIARRRTSYRAVATSSRGRSRVDVEARSHPSAEASSTTPSVIRVDVQGGGLRATDVGTSPQNM
ncbi:MAG: hypothetical protein IPH13_20140 [Planctomycetes bacterium]|nr:hypothetical protein [Planctomycetota bacterium]